MNEFDVKRKLAQRSEQVNNESAPQMTNGIPNSVLADVFSGKQKATSEMMGHRSNLAPSIAAKMSQSFGMDVSGVQVYRSDAMAGSTMHGMAQGNKVVISSDVDLNTLEGQAVLGHELSHIRAQSMGVGTGNGLLHDAGLEQQADAEGMLAARGMSIGGESMGMSMGLGMAGLEGVSPMSGGLGATAAAPMQADAEKDEAEFKQLSDKRERQMKSGNSEFNTFSYGDAKRYNELKSKLKDDNAAKVQNTNSSSAVSYGKSSEAQHYARWAEFKLEDGADDGYQKKWFDSTKAKYLKEHGIVRDVVPLLPNAADTSDKKRRDEEVGDQEFL